MQVQYGHASNTIVIQICGPGVSTFCVSIITHCNRHVYLHLALIELSHRGREKDIIVSPKTLWEHHNYHSYYDQVN